MNALNHVATGVLCSNIYLVAIEESQVYSISNILASILGSLLPDVDNPRSTVGRLIPPLSAKIYNKYGHRTITHSVTAIAFLLLLVFVINSLGLKNTLYAKIFLVSYISHIIIDMATFDGVTLFYPFSDDKFFISKNEKFRLRNRNIKHEGVFFLFVSLTHVCLLSVFLKGSKAIFYEKTNTIANVHREVNSSDLITFVKYDVIINGQNFSGEGTVIEAYEGKIILFDKKFVTIDHNSKILKLFPFKGKTKLEFKKFEKNDMTIDDLNSIVKNKCIIALNVRSDQMLETYKEDKVIQSKALFLEKVYNPKFSLVEKDKIKLDEIDLKISSLQKRCAKSNAYEREILTVQIQELTKLKANQKKDIIQNKMHVTMTYFDEEEYAEAKKSQ
jgi:membrane-bound metal-dependent hydrolase YbcI (DUF457 family)